ncbi:hypothetical protein, partial [Pseudomonas syringae group genomosp. 7]|uniref:hypothetical protein n=1 Tax=Pseudomonas syringae group genomosp. 7 TaxID=251699 RepID=UPI00376FB27C
DAYRAHSDIDRVQDHSVVKRDALLQDHPGIIPQLVRLSVTGRIQQDRRLSLQQCQAVDEHRHFQD